MGLTSYVIRRIIIAIPTFLAVTVLVFFLIQMTPGSPLDFYLSANPEMSYIDPGRIELLEERMGLDEPVYKQYFMWLKDLLTLNFGTSFATGKSISSQIFSRLGNTVLLFVFSHMIGWPIAIGIGILSAIKKDTIVDHLGRAFGLVGISMPNFWFGIMLIMGFSVYLDLFPISGTVSTSANYSNIFQFIGDRIWHLILPSLTIAANTMAATMRTMRAEVLEVMNKDYITTARSKGLKERIVVLKHILRNSLMAVITLMGLIAGVYLFAGAVLTEQVFGWPGIGRYLVKSVYVRDYPAVMSVTVLIATMVILFNLLTDISYALINPKIRY